MALTDKLKAIADAIRSKTGNTDSMTLDQMDTEVSNISTGGGNVEEPYIKEIYDASGEMIEAKLVGYTKIRRYLFNNCSKLTLISLPSGITDIGERAFSYCSKLTLTSLPSGVTKIGNYAFDNCSKLTLISLPSGITDIGVSAFSHCSKLTLTSLPSGITNIASNTFDSC